jgi:hypothetical protein
VARRLRGATSAAIRRNLSRLDEDEAETAEPTDKQAESSDGPTSTVGPGLGFLAGLAGVGAGAWLRNRDRDAEDDPDESERTPSTSSEDRTGIGAPGMTAAASPHRVLAHSM